VVGKTATLELSSRFAERLALAHQLGTLSLALRSLVDAGKEKVADAGESSDADTIVIYRGTAVEAFSCTPNCDHRVTAGASSSAPAAPAVASAPAPAGAPAPAAASPALARPKPK
jgi:hypothetical protein